MNKKRFIGTLLTLTLPSLLLAQSIQLSGQQTLSVPLNKPGLSQAKQGSTTKEITLLKVDLSDTAHQELIERMQQQAQASLRQASAESPKSHQLGMGKVPVLDQGAFGTCVTFAVSAALDAALNKGDHISQVCSLILGNHIEKQGYIPSGWNGSWAPYVLSQFETFGAVSQSKQQRHGCGGYTYYPGATSATPTAEISIPEYHLLSEPVIGNQLVTWRSILNAYEFFLDKIEPNQTLNKVKQSLNEGDRLTFAVMLPAVERGVAGAIGMHYFIEDSWVLTPEIKKAIESESSLAAHEMVITGYDDNAVAYDLSGTRHKGLLTLRNSWGKWVGYFGEFYMSYDYFKTLAFDIERIHTMN